MNSDTHSKKNPKLLLASHFMTTFFTPDLSDEDEISESLSDIVNAEIEDIF